MKRYTCLTLYSLLLLGLAACTQDDPLFPQGDVEGTPMTFTATGLTLSPKKMSSRATVDGDWQGVDTVALQVGNEVKKYKVTSSGDYKKATLSSDDPFYWINRNDITVSAWWPYDKDNLAQMPPVVVEQDQSSLENFQKSDFIEAHQQTVQFDNPTLTFTHRTARVVVELTAGNGITSVDGATVNLTGLSTKSGNPNAITSYYIDSKNTHEALIVPQTIEADKPFIQIMLNGITYIYHQPEELMMAAGKRYTYTIKVNTSGLEAIGCSIGNWTDGDGETGMGEAVGYTYDETTNTYTVYNRNGLMAWAEAARSDLSTNCILADNIAMPTVGDGEGNWTPVGSSNINPYTGTFEGGGHSITGLAVHQPDMDYVGMFGYIKGTVRNLTLMDVKITGTDNVGGVVGRNSNGATVSGCSATATVTGSGSGNVGGVAGYNRGTVTACYTTGDVSATATGNYIFVGGMVGQNDDTLTACYWANNQEHDFGSDNNNQTTMKVDGTNITWTNAQSGMNTAIDAWNQAHPDNPCNGRYEGATATTPPTLASING